MKLKPNDITLAALDDMVVNSDESDDEIIDEEYQSFYDFLNSHFPITNEVNLNLVESQIQTDQRYKRLLVNRLSLLLYKNILLALNKSIPIFLHEPYYICQHLYFLLITYYSIFILLKVTGSYTESAGKNIISHTNLHTSM